MRTDRLFRELSKYLTGYQVTRLELAFTLAPSIIMATAVHDISKEYTSQEEKEDIVCLLMEELCKKHFQTRRSANKPNI